MKPLKLCVTLLMVLAVQGGACDRMARRHPITLEGEVFDFHSAVRAQNYDQAALHMAPRWRQAFLTAWRKGARVATIHELEVVSMAPSEDVEYARVEAVVRYLTKDSLVEKEHFLHELWRGEGKGWYLDALVDGPAEFREDLAPSNWQAPEAESPQ